MLERKKLKDILLFLTLLFLPTQLGKHFWPDFAFIYSLKIDYLSPTLYFWDLLAGGLLLVWLLSKPKVNKAALNILLIFLLTQGLSILGAKNPGAGLVRLEQYLVSGFFGLFLASQNAGDLLRKAALPLAIGVAGESALVFYQFFSGETLGFWILGERSFNISTPAIAKFDFYGFSFLRPYGTFPHPNVMAAFMLVALYVIFISAKSGKALSGSIIESITFFLGAASIFLSMSRAAFIAGLCFLIVVLHRKWFIVAAVIILALSPVFVVRFTSLFNFDNLTLLRREELITGAWQIFLIQPLFGVGLNNFVPVLAADLLSGPSRFLQPVHNILLLVAAESGIVGLAGFIVFLGYPVKIILNSKLFSKLPLAEKILSLLPWVFIAFLGMFDHYFLTLPQGYRMLFLLWGLSLSQVTLSRHSKS